MSDQDKDKGPLSKRGKGLEDEWIRRKEAEEAEAQKRKDGGDLTNQDDRKSPETEDKYDGREGDGRKMFIALGVAIVCLILFALVF
ncbi:MAG TPA: hypothetical protein V6D22_08225 [Candidatus Obscuribacterales bacterium]